MTAVRVVCLSDTHGSHEQVRVPDGDVLIFAGDACNYGTLAELSGFAIWWRKLPHPHKVFVAGNHDWPFERDKQAAIHLLGRGTTYLEDDEVTVAGLRIYGSPWTPEFCAWAFNLPRGGGALERRWANIPGGLDILVTHGPALATVDGLNGRRLGDKALADSIANTNPRYHICGHIHGGERHDTFYQTEVFNVSICDEEYIASRQPKLLVVHPAPAPRPADTEERDG